jgi:hypothetical protein
MLHAILLASLISLFAIAEVSAQTAPKQTEDFSGIANGRTVIVTDDTGLQTKGSILRFTPDQLTMRVQDRDVSFERRNVVTVFERGDSLKNGMKIGGIAAGALGAVIGFAIATQSECDNNMPCNAAESLAIVALPTAIFGLIGMGTGAGIDALSSGERQLYGNANSTGQVVANDFTGLSANLPIVVREDSGVETRGHLLRLMPDSLTMMVSGREQTIAHQRVSAIFARGDSVKNGAGFGFLTGAAAGAAIGVSKTQCGRNPVGIGYISAYLSYSPCTGGERLRQGLGVGALLGVVGTGLGAGIDALIPGRRLLFEPNKRAAGATMSIAPSLTPSRVGLLTSVSW